MDLTSELHSEIRERLGVLPNFFRLAPDEPEIAANLWAYAKFGYLDNPLPALFKERLFVSLSRFCAVRYCVARHVGFLIGLGKPSGDGHVQPETAQQVVELLRRPVRLDDELEPSLALLSDTGVLAAELESNSPLEAAVFDCAAHIFLQSSQAEVCRAALQRSLDSSSFQHVLVFLAFVRTAHFWTVVHPELEVERDLTELLSIQEALAECVVASPEHSVTEPLRLLVEERESLQEARRVRVELERTNAQLREERERLRVTLASIGDGVIATDTSDKITNMNAVAEALTGWTNDEAVGLPIDQVFRIIEESSREPIDNPGTQPVREGSTQSLSRHVLLVAKDGTERPIEDTAAPIRGAEGQTLGGVLIFRDVTERRAKQKASELLAAIVESSDDAIISKSLDSIIQSWNLGAERLFGYRAEEAIGRHIGILLPPELAMDEASIIARIKRGERIVNVDTERVHRDGHRVVVSETISPVKDGEGHIIGVSKVVHDITDRRKLEETLEQVARDRAEANRRKDQFLAVLAHELRNPLSPMRSCIHVLKAASTPAHRGPLDIMDRQVNQMVRLIDDLLDIARISRGQLGLRKDQTVFQKLIADAIESVQTKLDDKELSVAIEAPTVPVMMIADAARLTQVLANLLTNAAKHSPEQAAITLRLVVDEQNVRVSVTDEGVGIPEDKIDEIFEMFSQIEGPEQKTQGLGIGLTIAKEIVELHGGALTARSDGLGAGAAFTVTLPLVSEPAPAALPPSQHLSAEAAPYAGVRVLVVDDSQDSAVALSRLLELRGCSVKTVFDGPNAIEAARSFAPDVVLLDIGMPGMSGLEVAEHLRRETWSKNMMLVALSGWGQPADLEKSRKAGFDEHLVKPAELGTLDRILGEVSKQRASQPHASRRPTRGAD